MPTNRNLSRSLCYSFGGIVTASWRRCAAAWGASRIFRATLFFPALRFRSLQFPALQFPALVLGTLLVEANLATRLSADEPRQIVQWPFAEDGQPRAPATIRIQNHGVEVANQAAQFDGRGRWLAAEGGELQSLGTGDFTVTMHVNVPATTEDVPGDLISLYDPETRRGFQISLKTHEVTMSRSNARTLHFGIDQDRLESWTDHGRVGQAVFVFGFAVHQGQLYAATCEGGPQETGHVYRWDGEKRWIDCRIPVRSNAVSALLVHDGELFAGTAKYRLGGSALQESTNQELGGQIFRYTADGQWEDCGRLPGVEAVGGLTVFQNRIYATSLYRPAGFFRYDGGQQWTALETPGGKRVEALCAFNGNLFASSYDEGHVYRFDGERWTDCGQVGDATNTQTYSFAVYRGDLYVGTWRSGKVYRYDGDNQWIDRGRLGEELEVMGMLVHNGRLLAGSLPLAGVFQYQGETTWKSLGLVDETPDVMYRRAWTLVEFGGRAFVGTLPAGRVLSTSAGVNVTYDRSFPEGWHAIAARRAGPRLSLFIDGKQVAQSPPFEPAQYDLSINQPLQVGFGPTDYFRGQLRDLQLFRGALSDEQIAEMAKPVIPE